MYVYIGVEKNDLWLAEIGANIPNLGTPVEKVGWEKNM